MNISSLLFLASLSTPLAAAEASDSKKDFNILHHLGGNSPWFPAPSISGLDINTIPSDCKVSKAIYTSRHASRFPDPGAYNEWTTFHQKIQNATFEAHGELSFLKSWKPVVEYPTEQLAQLSIGGWGELFNFGATLRRRYLAFWTPESNKTVFANNYPRTISSAQLFLHGYLGPQASAHGTVAVVTSSNPLSLSNSLAPSDLCPMYHDNSDPWATQWDAIYLPPILERVQKLIKGDLKLQQSEIALGMYLCGFESQITGKKSEWCGVWREQEVRGYEYRQDLRYWYGNGSGAGVSGSMMVEYLGDMVAWLDNGEDEGLKVAFTHDGQINQLASALGVFDGHAALNPRKIMENRTYKSSNITPMRGNVALERMDCTGKAAGKYVRVILNDAVYPVVGCQDGPGKSCELEKYQALVKEKMDKFGSFQERCGLNGTAPVRKSFLVDLDQAFVSLIKP